MLRTRGREDEDVEDERTEVEETTGMRRAFL
jgi:hypothetical protein